MSRPPTDVKEYPELRPLAWASVLSLTAATARLAPDERGDLAAAKTQGPLPLGAGVSTPERLNQCVVPGRGAG